MSKLADFNVPAALALADSILSQPPAWPWIERHEGRGTLVQRFVLPLDLCRPQNMSRHTTKWGFASDSGRVYRLMTLQARTLRYPEPLPGRPQLRAIRFSCVPTDAYSDWAKLAIDRLCCPRGRAVRDRLGLLRDDNPKQLEVRQWCEKAPRGQGLVLIEVWSGDEVVSQPAPAKKRKGMAA